MKKIIFVIAAMMLMLTGCKRNAEGGNAPATEVVTPADSLAPADSLTDDTLVVPDSSAKECDADCECSPEQPCDQCEGENE